MAHHINVYKPRAGHNRLRDVGTWRHFGPALNEFLIRYQDADPVYEDECHVLSHLLYIGSSIKIINCKIMHVRINNSGHAEKYCLHFSSRYMIDVETCVISWSLSL